MTKILDGKALSLKIQDELKEKNSILIKEFGKTPKLAVFLVGDDPASVKYVRNKGRACEKIGIEFENVILPKDTSEKELLEKIEEYNKREDITGILAQYPFPEQINYINVFNTISPEKDVDGLNPYNIGERSFEKNVDNDDIKRAFESCTPIGIITLLEENNIEIEGKNVVIIGRSFIVGRPLYDLFLRKNATVTICHTKTQNIKEITSKADIVVSAIGKPEIITEDYIKEGAIVVDVGINVNEEGKLVGDVDFENVSKKTSAITPVPGGVGPMTIAMLMKNTIKAFEKQNRKE